MSDLIDTEDKPKQQPTKGTKEQALANLLAIDEQLKPFIGKDHHNPFLWKEQTGFNRLLKALQKDGEVGETIIEEALNLKFEAPHVNILS